MGLQRGDLVKLPRQLGLGQGGVDLTVADIMQQNHRSALAPFQFWDQMVQALRHSGRDGAVAQGTYGVRIAHAPQ